MRCKFFPSTGRDHTEWQPEASHHDGVLEVRIPVREEAKPRKIAVGAGAARELPAE